MSVHFQIAGRSQLGSLQTCVEAVIAGYKARGILQPFRLNSLLYVRCRDFVGIKRKGSEASAPSSIQSLLHLKLDTFVDDSTAASPVLNSVQFLVAIAGPGSMQTSCTAKCKALGYGSCWAAGAHWQGQSCAPYHDLCGRRCFRALPSLPKILENSPWVDDRREGCPPH